MNSSIAATHIQTTLLCFPAFHHQLYQNIGQTPSASQEYKGRSLLLCITRAYSGRLLSSFFIKSLTIRNKAEVQNPTVRKNFRWTEIAGSLCAAKLQGTIRFARTVLEMLISGIKKTRSSERSTRKMNKRREIMETCRSLKQSINSLGKQRCHVKLCPRSWHLLLMTTNVIMETFCNSGSTFASWDALLHSVTQFL